MKIECDGNYRTVTGNLEVKLLSYFPDEPQYPWVGAVMYDGKVIACQWTTDGRAQNKLHNLYDADAGHVYVAKVFIAVSGKDFDDAQINLERELQEKVRVNDDWLGWSYEWSVTQGDYGRIRHVQGANPDEFNHFDFSLTEAWNNAKPHEDI